MVHTEGGGAGGLGPHQAGLPARGAQILVADDDPHAAALMARALRAKGFVVEVARDGRTGVDRAMRRTYDLVLLDPRMRGADALTALERLRRRRPRQRVMVVTAGGSIGVLVRCLELGAVDVLAKPFDLAELLARAAVRAAGPPGAAGSATASDGDERYVRVGSITLDLFRHTVDAGGGAGPVPLSLREFELLRCLMRHAGMPCTREQLLDEVWDTPFETGTNVVDVYVHRLRHKLGGGRIATLRNVGYLLEPV